MTTAEIPKLIGAKIKRREDPRLITGSATYVDDIQLVGMLHAAIVRSEHAAARIVRIDTSAAAAMPGVVAVVTGADLKAMCGPMITATTGALPTLKVPDKYPLAVDRVVYAGEAVAAVVARSRYEAADAAAAVKVEYEPLPAVVDVEQAARPDARRVHEQFDSNVAAVWSLTTGDIDDAFARADRIVSQRMVNQRLIPNAIEPRGVVAQYRKGQNDELTVWTSTQIPHLIKTLLSLQLGIPEQRTRIIAPEVGGGFGAKLNLYPEEAIVAALAIKTGRPVKWIESRAENFQATTHGRDQIAYYDLAVRNDGTILGMKVRIIADLGAYHQLLTALVPTLSGLMLPGCYKIPALQAEIQLVFTNKTPTDAYRGAGRPEATYYIERMLDIVAAELGIDPVEVRRRNFPAPSEFPFTSATGLVYDSGNYQLALDRALALAGYTQLREEQAQLRQQGRYLGIGLSTYVEVCGMGPSPAMPAGGWESATVRVERTGKVTVITGASPHGQGQETSFAQIAADELGVPIDDVIVLHGDTGVGPPGLDTYGSRATAVGGAALMMSLGKVKEKAKKFAAHIMDASEDDLVFENGRFSVRGSPDRNMTIAQIAFDAWNAIKLPAGLEPGLEATSFFEPTNFTYPFGAHVCVVEVEQDTGEVQLRRYVAVDDCGRVINPLLVDGQLHGGLAQGIGQALWEEAVYDENGQLLTGTFADYAMPRADDFPRFELERTETPTPVNPLGAKGIGEAATIGATPAVVNAVVDALAPFGVRHVDMSLRPEKLWRLMHHR
jgi:carbon-monoxide dehydrogenase large subunit